MDERQPLLGAVVEVAQPLVVEAQQVQDRGVQLVDAAGILDGLVAELVGRAVAECLSSRPRRPARR